MMWAALPPSSKVNLVPRPANAFWIDLPTSVGPVKATLSRSGCFTNAAPVAPAPVTRLKTPSGSPASWQISAKSNAVSGVVSAGFKTTVFPQASAGATFHATINNGKFHGMICPATPTGETFFPGNA